jgi:predicted acetyltransferase
MEMIEFRSLRENEMEDWFDHCMWVFNNSEYSESCRQYFADHWYNDPWKDIDSIFVAADGGKILSTVRVFHRNIFISGQAISMGGIGEVSTKPEYQGKGLSGTLLKNAISLMKKRKINTSILFTGKWGHYGRYDWKQCIICSNVSDVPMEPSSKYNFRSANINTDLESLKSIYTEYSKNHNGPLIRDSSFYWEHWLSKGIENRIINNFT